MSRKANNLRKRLRTITESRVKYCADLKRREERASIAEAAAARAEADLKKRTALTITVEESRIPHVDGECHLNIRMWPGMIYRQAMRDRGGMFMDVNEMAYRVAHEAAHKIRVAIAEFATSKT